METPCCTDLRFKWSLQVQVTPNGTAKIMTVSKYSLPPATQTDSPAQNAHFCHAESDQQKKTGDYILRWKKKKNVTFQHQPHSDIRKRERWTAQHEREQPAHIMNLPLIFNKTTDCAWKMVMNWLNMLQAKKNRIPLIISDLLSSYIIEVNEQAEMLTGLFQTVTDK